MSQRLPTGAYLLTLFVLLLSLLPIYRTVLSPEEMRVTVCVVGKGRATLVESGGHMTLVDTGSDASILRCLGENLSYWRREVDTVILTGSGSASTGGLAALGARYRLGDVLRAGTVETPYGSRFTLPGDIHLTVAASGIFLISYETSTLRVSSSTPAGIYFTD